MSVCISHQSCTLPCKQLKVTARVFFRKRCSRAGVVLHQRSRLVLILVKARTCETLSSGKNIPIMTTIRFQEELLPFKLLEIFGRRTSGKTLCHPLVVHSRREAGLSISKVSRCPTADQEISCTRFTANNETSGRDLGREENVTWYRQNKTAVCMPESRGRKLRAKQVTSTTQTPKPTPLSDGMIKRQKDKRIDRQAKK